MFGDSQTCCCFLSAKIGTYVLGALTAIALLSEVDEFIPSRFGPNIAMVAFFFAMIMNDSEKSRHAFFACYFTGNMVLLIVDWWMIQRFIFAEMSWDIACKNMKDEGKLDAFAPNMAEC